ncbi:MAG: hypothetical protein KBS59_02925 [Clostridiales bacterium]|nr:hypothetical protein [Clostridiales bacterium]
MYGKNAEELTGRLRRFYGGEGTSILQIRGIEECECKEPQKPLNSWNFDTELEAYLDDRARRAVTYWENRADIDDMMLPSVTAWFGIAEHTAWLGGKVDFSDITSYNHQILDNLDDIDTLKIDPDNVWFSRVGGGIKYLKEKWGDKIFPRLRGADAPSDIANIVRGGDLFYDVYDDPDAVRKLADFCADGMKYYFSRQQQAAGQLCGGYITGFDIWLPGNSVGQISEDASCMMSPQMYNDIFLDALKKSVDGYDHVMMHTHSLGAVHLPTFASIKNISVLEISSDPNAERAVEIWRKYKDVLRDKIVIVAPTFDELKNNLDLISSYRNIIWYYAKTKDEAREVCRIMKDLGVK